MSNEEEELKQLASSVLHWNYRSLTQFPTALLKKIQCCRKIKDIYLKENLITRLPSDIVALDRLESLYLSGNEIRTVPKEISRLQRLRCLDLSGNYLTTLPEEVGELSSLRYLVLDDNMLQALPLRLADIRRLRYLSVCDNRITWLPERPVFNLQHCELRVWRNPLHSLPYSLWYHMFRDQQIASLHIGCWDVAGASGTTRNGCVLKMHSDAAEWEIEIPFPGPYRRIMSSSLLDNTSPVSLLECCKRWLYRLLREKAKQNSRKILESLYADPVKTSCKESPEEIEDVNGNVTTSEEFDLQNKIVIRQDVSINVDSVEAANIAGDENNNGAISENDTRNTNCNCNESKQTKQCEATTAELVENYLSMLPFEIQRDMKNGPPSRCENVPCRNPVFDYAYLQFCSGSLQLIDAVQPCVLSAVFCSRGCARRWAGLKSGVVPWRGATVAALQPPSCL